MLISGVCLAFRRRWLIPTLVASCLAYLGILTYFFHFGRPLSILTVFNQWNEAWQVGDAAVETVPRWAFLRLVATLAVKLTLLLTMPKTRFRVERLGRRRLRDAGLRRPIWDDPLR